MKKRIALPALLLVICILLCMIIRVISFSGFFHIKGNTYYWDHTHFLHDQWKKVKGVDCCFDHDGTLYEGWYLNNQKRMFLISGIPVTGRQTINDHEYYFNLRGIMSTGIVTDGSEIHYYSEEGIRKTGWVSYEGNTYYFTKDHMQTGWFKEGNRRYYFRADGHMVTGWNRIQKQLYYFNTQGQMIRNRWIKDRNNIYYLYDDGHAACGRSSVQGKIYFFSKDGRLLKNTWVGNSYAGGDGSLQTDKNIDGLWVDDQGNKIYDGSYGSGGSLFIPSVRLQVPAWKTKGGKKGQEITDEVNSAAYLTSFNKPVIADHKTQGFEVIKESIPRRTIAFILTSGTVTEYVCTDIFTGLNTEHDLLDPGGKSIDERAADLCLYTCNENWKNVTIVLFKKK